MPVAPLDDKTINGEGLGKPKPRAREPREPDRVVKKVEPITEEEPIRMGNPMPEEEEEIVEEESISDIYRKILSPEHREMTKKVLTMSDEGKELLSELNINLSTDNQLSAWETECLLQLRSSLSQFQGIENLEVSVQLQVNLPMEPFKFIVKQ
jgi:hypothetical protein